MDSLEMQRTSVKQEDSTEDSDIEFIGASSQPLSSRPTASASTAPKGKWVHVLPLTWSEVVR